MKIKIEKLYDEHDCETCGPSYAEGAIVYFDDAQVLDLTPSAHCFDGENYNDDDIYKAIIDRLGHTIEFVESEDAQ